MCRSLQAWKCVGEEMPVCCAEAVAPRGIPVTLAAAPAEQPVRAGGAFCRAFAALRQKGLARGRSKRSFDGAAAQVAQLPLIQNIKVAGIKASVPFHREIMAAGAGGSAGGRRHSQQDAQIILKIADTDVIALLQLLIPDIKNAAQKPAIKLRRRCRAGRDRG